MSSARDKVRAGENVVAEVPVVIPDVASHDTAFCCHAFTMSLKECGPRLVRQPSVTRTLRVLPW